MPLVNGIWTPKGFATIGSKAPERVELSADAMAKFGEVQAFFTRLNLGLHCAKCSADIVGKNAYSDGAWSATCGCREFVGPNKHQRSES